MEALLLTLNVACMTYLCWRVYKSTGKSESKRDPDLGMFGIRDVGSGDASVTAAKKRRSPHA